jgi:hypothetical protein
MTMGGPPPPHFAGAGPTGTDGTQVPPTQPLPAAHGAPHEPQFTLSVFVSTHVPLQAVRPPPQFATHPLEKHTSPGGHFLPQAPQLLGSTLVTTHFPAQLVCVPEQPLALTFGLPASPPLPSAAPSFAASPNPGGMSVASGAASVVVAGGFESLELSEPQATTTATVATNGTARRTTRIVLIQLSSRGFGVAATIRGSGARVLRRDSDARAARAGRRREESQRTRIRFRLPGV